MVDSIRQHDERLRLVLVTDGVGDPNRIVEIAREAVAGGVRCLQLRESTWTARSMVRACESLLPVLQAVDGLLLVNDRVDVAASELAHGAQIGHRSLPPQLARRVLGVDGVLGYSAHDEDELIEAHRSGCDFALLSPVWPTTSKPGASFLGIQRASQLTEAASLPVVWLGGVHMETAHEIAQVPIDQRPVGVAVRSAIMLSERPRAAARDLLAALPF